MRRALASLVPVVVLAAACGGHKQPELGGGARFFPPDTVAFLATTPDADWRQLARLVLQRVPVVPATADEADIGVLPGGRTFVVSRTGSTWTVAHVLQKSLADSPRYEASQRAIPSEAPVRGYVRGDVAGRRLRAFPGQTTMTIANFGAKFRVIKHPTTDVSIAFLQFGWGAAWRTDDGLAMRVHIDGLPLAKSQRVRTVEQLAGAYAPGLFDEIPADALRVLDLPIGASTFQLMSTVPRQLSRLFPRAGAGLPVDLDQILGGETAVYTRRGGETTLVTSPADVAAAERALDELLAAKPPFFRDLALHRASIGGQLVVSTKASGIAAFRGGGSKLSADRAFRDAGIPAQVTLLGYERGKTAVWGAPLGSDATYTARFLGGHS